MIRVNPLWRFRLIEKDPDDNKFVDCAICSRANYLVSNDRHLSVLKTIPFPSVNVVSLQEFVDLI